MTADATKANVATYRQVEFPLFKGEERIFQRFLRPGMGVLDLGCGSGRVTRPLAARGVRVIGADLVAAPSTRSTTPRTSWRERSPCCSRTPWPCRSGTVRSTRSCSPTTGST
ncbi:MAG TPA: hypothetical protein DIT48_06545 [Actinobacteria bacterium]|nr:hypothetical protein [Actinomycetota bacterium]HCP61547.1 hypothetical protein [Actinomycetota bacterium]